ncbi:aspartate/glutamate racemase family protein [Flavihumibacter rivuli]|uniref:aspartate/glutamate racemase family protein n=1 Tax=Flavihumibacter rivuli TaxID=2838156 RepID=UPI001BDE6F98|nr:aspartate/glutamate racemase family protein [Flavihumibacter rivuli]ULQ58320.1 aspartate/glutamate racemase family protein [Flavihumibacter rivuli]
MQKTIGLIGGMSWESSALYYKIINQEVKQKLGGVHSCKSLMYSVDFADIATLQHNGEWDKLSEIMINAARALESGGAEFIVLCTNTMHKLADDISGSVSIPMVHIADATGEAIKAENVKRVGLLGTKFTMEQDFLKQRLADRYAIETIIPSASDRDIVHDIIYQELVKGIITKRSQNAYLEIIDDLIALGAEAIVLGCTEIGLLISPDVTEHRLFDTTIIHAKKAVAFSLE